MADELEFKFECPKCGGTVIELPDDYTADSTAKCKQCGVSFGRWGDIQAKAMDLAKEHVRERFRSTFKGLKGWKLK